MAFTYMGNEGRSGNENDVLIGEKTIGGPLTGKDVRMYLDVKTLEALLDVARNSSVRRCQIDGLGVRVRTWRDKYGHCYDTWQIIGHKPKSESHLLFEGNL